MNGVETSATVPSLPADIRYPTLIRRLCATPYATVEELSRIYRLDLTHTHRTVNRVSERGLIRSVSHTLDSRRSSKRWIPTGRAIEGLAEWDGVRPQDILRTSHVSKQWQREISKRLDILACVYRLTAAICHIEGREPEDFRLYRSGCLDASVGLSGSRWLGIMVKRPAFGGTYFRDRLKFARATVLRLSGLFVVVPDRTAAQDALDAARQHLGRIACAIGMACKVGDTTTPVWSLPREPNARISLTNALERYSNPARDPHRRAYSGEDVPADLISMPLSLALKDKQLIPTISNWPLADLSRLSQLAGRGRRGTRNTLERLRARGLIQTIRLRGIGCYTLSDHGIDLISAAARTRAHDNRRAWSASRTESGLLKGTKLRKLAREIVHTHMTHQFIGDIRTHAMNDRRGGVRIDSITPPHNSERYFRLRGGRGRPHSLRPDACILMNVDGHDHALLVEIERTAVRPKAISRRLLPHRRYFDIGRAEADFGLLPKILFVVEREEVETRFLMSQESRGLDELPMFITNVVAIRRHGPLGATWLRPGYGEGDRVPFWSHG